jgi:hypothetical protein
MSSRAADDETASAASEFRDVAAAAAGALYLRAQHHAPHALLQKLRPLKLWVANGGRGMIYLEKS